MAGGKGVQRRGGAEAEGDAAAGASSSRSMLQDVKLAYPPMIVRFPEDCWLARFDRWLSLWIMSMSWGPLDHLTCVFGHLFNTPWNVLCTMPLVVLALEAAHPWDFLAWAVAALTVVPMALFLKERIGYGFFFDGGRIALGFVSIVSFLWAVDARAFQVACLYCSSWMYTLLLTSLLKGMAGRRRPALIMSEEVSKFPRPPLWSAAIAAHSKGDNAYHSFPSGDAAAAGCFAGAVLVGFGEVYWTALVLMALAMYGRVYIFAHHLLDVLAGAVEGAACTLAFAACASSDGYHVVLAWNILCVVSLAMLLIVGPAKSFLAMSALFTLTGWCIGRCWGMLAFYAGALAVGYYLYVKLSYDQKYWVMEHLEDFFSGVVIQEKMLPDILHGTLEKKRRELRLRAADASSAFPSDIYSIYAYTPDGSPGPKPFAGDWEDVARLMSLRLEDLSRQSGFELSRVDVVLGIYTGGALIAPLVASKLGCSVCYIRVNRYSDDVLGYMGSMRTMVQKITGRHDQLYTVSDAPDAALLKGKIVLMVDDAVGTGGTFRTAARFCMEAGARDVKGIALDTIKPGMHIWDPSLPRPAPQKLVVPCFLPWGLR